MELGLIDVIERSLATDGEWDVPVTRCLAAYLRPGDFYVDIGANIGWTTLLASRAVGHEGLVLAIEPGFLALHRLTQNLMLSEARNVVVASLAAGRGYSLEALSLLTINNVGASRLTLADDRPSQAAWVVDVADIVSRIGRAPKLIKIDVEGFEYEVLAGLAPVFTHTRPLVVCELTDAFLRDRGHNVRELLALMESFGYRARRLDPRLAPGDGELLLSEGELPTAQCDALFVPTDRP